MALIDPTLETYVLATLLQDLAKGMSLCVEAGMDAGVFHSNDNQSLYRALMEVWSEGVQVDRVMIARDFRKRGVLDSIGGSDRIQQLFATNESLTALPRMIEDLKDLRDRRSIHKAAKQAYEDVQGDVPTSELKALLEATVSQHGASQIETPTPTQLNNEVLDRSTSGKAIRTGFRAIDSICGLLYPGDFLVIGGGAKAGKSILSGNIAKNISRTLFTVVFTIEMNRVEYWRRAVCAEAGVPAGFWQEGAPPESQQGRALAAMQRLKSHKITIVDRAMEIEHAIAIARMLKAKHGELGAIVIDYIQMFDASVPGNPSRAEKVSYISRMCKKAAVELQCLVIGVSQLNDDGKSLDSRGIQRDSNLMLNITMDEHGNRTVMSAYNRNGPMGIPISLVPELHHFRFTDP